VAYRSLAGVIVEQHQWDAMTFTDPLPILRWCLGLPLPHSAIKSRSAARTIGQLKTDCRLMTMP
jgi:hypothetical protein